jgi:hypothetical protein
MWLRRLTKKLRHFSKKRQKKNLKKYFCPRVTFDQKKEKNLNKRLRTAHISLVVKIFHTKEFHTFIGPRPVTFDQAKKKKSFSEQIWKIRKKIFFASFFFTVL